MRTSVSGSSEAVNRDRGRRAYLPRASSPDPCQEHHDTVGLAELVRAQINASAV